MKKHIPNILTFLRGALTLLIVVLFFLEFPNKFVWIFGFFVLATFTDFLDGFLARRWKVVSTFGKVFDSLFDKILTLVMYMLLIPYDIVHAGVFVALLFRDVFVDGLKNYLLSKGAAVSPKITGKLKFIFQVIMIALMIAFLVYPGNVLLYYCVVVAASLALSFAYYSGFLYTRDFYRHTKS
jgi:CDP-diacylglycerol---glycerol-3-phosphate 3-phosphatidyltransferase